MDIQWIYNNTPLCKQWIIGGLKMAGKSGKHAGERFLVTLDPSIYAKLAEIAELEGLGLATKARQVLTMYANGITHVAAEQSNKKDCGATQIETTKTTIFDNEDWENN